MFSISFLKKITGKRVGTYINDDFKKDHFYLSLASNSHKINSKSPSTKRKKKKKKRKQKYPLFEKSYG